MVVYLVDRNARFSIKLTMQLLLCHHHVRMKHNYVDPISTHYLLLFV